MMGLHKMIGSLLDIWFSLTFKYPAEVTTGITNGFGINGETGIPPRPARAIPPLSWRFDFW